MRTNRNRFLVKFVGIDARDEAEGIRGALYVEESERRDLEEGEFWVDDLIGMRVLVEGAEVGKVEDVVPGSAHDLLSLRTPHGNRLVPVVEEIVTRVDLEAGTITLNPPDGLLD